MSDFTPTTFDPAQTMSNILGIQQKRQALQAGQLDIQAKQAELPGTQRHQAQMAAMANVVRNNPGKSTDELKDSIMAVGGDDAPDFLSRMYKIEDAQTQLKSAKSDLSAKNAGLFGNVLAAQVGYKGTGQDLKDRLDMAAAANPELKDMAEAAKAHIDAMPEVFAQPSKQRDLLIQNEALTYGGKNPQKAGTMDTGTQIQPVLTNENYGAVSPVGGAFNKENVQVLPTGQVGTVSRAGIAPVAGDANLTTAQAQTQNARAAGVTERVQQAQNQANQTVQTQDALTRAKAILESGEAPTTGKYASMVRDLKNAMASLGLDTKGADDMNTLTKNLARYEASRATASGLGGTDAARELAHTGSPSIALDNGALLGVVRQSLATEQALSAYANVQGKSKDPDVLAKNEADFRNIPKNIEAREYGMARNAEEANEMLRKFGMSADDMKKARAAVKEFDNR